LRGARIRVRRQLPARLWIEISHRVKDIHG
jgi:hypothetical protein